MNRSTIKRAVKMITSRMNSEYAQSMTDTNILVHDKQFKRFSLIITINPIDFWYEHILDWIFQVYQILNCHIYIDNRECCLF